MQLSANYPQNDRETYQQNLRSSNSHYSHVRRLHNSERYHPYPLPELGYPNSLISTPVHPHQQYQDRFHHTEAVQSSNEPMQIDAGAANVRRSVRVTDIDQGPVLQNLQLLFPFSFFKFEKTLAKIGRFSRLKIRK